MTAALGMRVDEAPGVTTTEGEVVLSWVDLDAFELPPDWDAYLTPDEHARATKFRFPVHRWRFVARRIGLRRVLASCLDCNPKLVSFESGALGKLRLGGIFCGEDLEFSVSSSGNYAVYAITRGRLIGVDVEQIQSEFPYESVASRCFSPLERRALQALPKSLRRDAFFCGWVKKEAYAKALGYGLSLEFSSFTLSLSVYDVSELIETPSGGFGVVTGIPAPARCAAAVCVHSPSSAARLRAMDAHTEAVVRR